MDDNVCVTLATRQAVGAPLGTQQPADKKLTEAGIKYTKQLQFSPGSGGGGGRKAEALPDETAVGTSGQRGEKQWSNEANNKPEL